jgi:hypothetical protein
MMGQKDYIAMTPNGRIYLPTAIFLEDFSSSGVREDLVALFIHEMVHVWQYQLGYSVKLAGVLETPLGMVFGFGYNYTIKFGAKLSDFSMEAQGNILADYALYLFYGSAQYSSRKQRGKQPYSRTELEVLLKDFLANPSDKCNLPRPNNSLYEAEPNSAISITR